MRKSTSYVLVSLILMIGLIVTTLIVSYTFLKIKEEDLSGRYLNKIDVVGYSEVNFPANILKFQTKLNFNKMKQFKESLLKAGVKKESFKNVLNEEIYIETENIRELESFIHNKDSISKYELKIIKKEYHCTDVEDIKIKLLLRATKNARAKAGTIAEYSGNKLGPLLNSDLGTISYKDVNFEVEYITPSHLNKSEKRKIAKMTINQSYGVR